MQQVAHVETLVKIVTLDDGSKIEYDYLVIATGADPRVLPVPGSDLKNVIVMRNVKDSVQLENGFIILI